MRCTITCDGTPVGTVDVDPLSGLAHAHLHTFPAYDNIRDDAVEAAQYLRGSRSWSVTDGDFAETFARSWGGGRLALCDSQGVELGVASVVIIDWVAPSSPVPWPRVVIDARPDMARIEAFLGALGRKGGGRSRPAA